MNEAWTDQLNSGMGRLNFFLGKVSIVVAMAFAVAMLGPASPLLWWIGLIVSFASFVLDVMRLRNIGVSQWFAILRLVPYVNLVYMILIQSAQPGWIETRTLDKTGKNLLIFQVALLIVLIVLASRMGSTIPTILF